MFTTGGSAMEIVLGVECVRSPFAQAPQQTAGRRVPESGSLHVTSEPKLSSFVPSNNEGELEPRE